MKRAFLMIERIVLESLVEKRKNKCELLLDTGLDVELINNVLYDLETDQLILRKGDIYHLNMKKIAEVSDKKQVKNELKELFAAWVNRFFSEEKKKSTYLKVKKVYMNDAEEMLYNEHLNKLNRFIEHIKETTQKENRKCLTAKKKVVFWGHGEYQALVESSLNAF